MWVLARIGNADLLLRSVVVRKTQPLGFIYCVSLFGFLLMCLCVVAMQWLYQ